MGKKGTLIGGAILGVLLVLGGGYALSRIPYIPPKPLAMSRHFIELAEAGELRDAYLLTNQGALVGKTPTAFEVNIRRQFAIDAFPEHREIRLLYMNSGFQSYGNRLRRWLLGRKLDADQVSFDYVVGGLPVEIQLVSHDGEWRIAHFQSHAM